MNLLYAPLDIDLTNFSFTQYDNSLENNRFNPYWNSSFISNDVIEKNNFKNVLNQLPFIKITRLIYKTQRRAVAAHVDVMKEMVLEDGEYDHILENEPCGYRIVVKGSLNKLHLFNGTNWVNAVLPQTPCCYILNSTTCLHKVDYDAERITIYVRGFVDKEKHKSLLEKSLKVYGNYAVYSE